jgi:hypothetical protein
MSDHLSKADSHLYGFRAPKRQKKEISSSTTLAFSSQLAALLASTPSSSASSTSRARPRPSSSKPSLFTKHNKGASQRALRDLEASSPSLPGLAPDDLHKSKLKLEEKARKYAALKRGDYIPGANEAEQLIDFDRKWAENEARGQGNDLDTSSDSDNDDWVAGEETVEYLDEYGRARTGTKAEADRMERKMRNALLGAEELDRISARPTAPSQIIYGDTIQTAAFNPDAEIESAMASLAAKRDRSATPPPETHYEADKEVRSRGAGFFKFSADEGIRKAEMEALEKQRMETERIRAEKAVKINQRREEVERRRRELREKRAQKEADGFLESLGGELAGKSVGDAGFTMSASGPQDAPVQAEDEEPPAFVIDTQGAANINTGQPYLHFRSPSPTPSQSSNE